MVIIDDWIDKSLGVLFPPTQPQPGASVIPSTSNGTGTVNPGTGYGRTDGAPSAPPSTGSGTSSTGGEWNPRGQLPPTQSFTSKEDAIWAETQAGYLVDYWKSKKANAEYRLLQSGGTPGEKYDRSRESVTTTPPFLPTYDGVPHSEAEMAIIRAQDGKAKGDPAILKEIAEAETAIADVVSYQSQARTRQGDLKAGAPSTYAGGGGGVNASGSVGTGSGGSGSTPAKPKPVVITVRQFMDAISQQESGGDYNVTNPNGGAHGRFQIMPQNWPSWSVEAGLPAGSAPTPENQDRVAEYKMQQYFNQYGNWADVASVWYSGRPISTMDKETANAAQEHGPTIAQYVASIMGKLPDAGGGVTGENGDPLGDYLKSGAYGLEKARAGETDRQYGNQATRAKDVLSMMGAENALLEDIMSAKKASQAMSDDASATAANVNKLVKEGKTPNGYYDEMAGPMWSDPLAQYIKKLKTAPEGFSDSFLHQIPKEVPMEYYLNSSLGMPMPSGERWAGGTLRRFAGGTLSPQDEPYLALYKAGKAVPAAALARLQAAGLAGPAGQGTTWTPNSPAPAAPAAGSVIPPTSGTYQGTYTPGHVPINATLPAPERVYDTNDWLDAAVETMARNITAGNSGLPASWGVMGLESWHGVPAAQMPASFLNQLREVIRSHKDTPEIQQAFGKDPGIATTWVKDPNAPPEAPRKATPGTGGGGNYGTGANTQAQQYSGTYGGGAAAQGDPDLDKKLGWEREQFRWTKELQQAQLDLARIQDTRSAEYQAAQIRQMEASQKINEAQLELQKLGDTRSEAIFQENLRAAKEQERITGIKLDMEKIRMESDIRFQQEDLELKKQAGALSQSEYEERKRQFDQTFGYQKEKDERAYNLERAKTTAQIMANPNNTEQQQFWYAGMADPKGKAYDVFAGEYTGDKTYTEAYNEDAKIYEKAMRPPKLASGGFIMDELFITGDNPKGNKATGFEESIYNPTKAPLAVINNKLSRKVGVVPPKGHEFADNIRKGAA